jgi:hypothetical protein
MKKLAVLMLAGAFSFPAVLPAVDFQSDAEQTGPQTPKKPKKEKKRKKNKQNLPK